MKSWKKLSAWNRKPSYFNSVGNFAQYEYYLLLKKTDKSTVKLENTLKIIYARKKMTVCTKKSRSTSIQLIVVKKKNRSLLTTSY